MMEKDGEEACGLRHSRSGSRRGHRSGCTSGLMGFHGGKIDVERPRVRASGGHELVLPSCQPNRSAIANAREKIVEASRPACRGDESGHGKQTTSTRHDSKVHPSNECLVPTP
jgi:hypothetical protein